MVTKSQNTKVHRDARSSLIRLASICITIVVALFAIVLYFHNQQQQYGIDNHNNNTDTSVTNAKTSENVQLKSSYDHVQELEARQRFTQLWQELNSVDRRNLQSSITRIPSFMCRVKVIESYLVNYEGLYDTSHPLFNFVSQCPPLPGTNETDASVHDESNDNHEDTAAAAEGNEKNDDKSSTLSVKQHMNIANQHNEVKKQPYTPLHEQLMKKREEYVLNPDSVLPLVPKEYFQIKLAYILLLHNNIEHVKRLISRIYHPDFYFVMHVDKKAPASYLKEVQSFVDRLLAQHSKTRKSNVFVFSSVSVTWGGSNMVFITMEAIKLLYTKFGNDWDYCINLSGADYPLRSNKEIIQELAVNAYFLGKKEVSYVDMHLNDLKDNKPIKLSFTECDNYLYLSGWRALPRGIDIWSGSQWFILHREFCDFLMHDEYLVPNFLTYIEQMMVPDELFFQTIMKASPFCHSVVHHHLRYIKWGDNAECFFDRIADSCGRHPDNFNTDDLPALKMDTLSLYARKFTSDLSLIDELDKWKDRPKDKRNIPGVFHFHAHNGTCLTAIDENTVRALPCNHMMSEEGIPDRSSLEEQEWMVGPCTDPEDVTYDEDQQCFTQTRNTTMCSLVNKKFGKCLDYSGPDEPTSPLILWPCHFQAKQLWKFSQREMSASTINTCSIITNLSTKIMIPDLCIDLNNEMTDALLWPCNDMPQQHFAMVRKSL